MNGEIKHLLTQFEYNKNISRELMLDVLKSAITTAARKKFGEQGGAARVEFSEDTGDFQVFCPRVVVEEVKDKNIEISQKDARRHKRGAKPGDEIEIEIPASSLGRIATQTARQVILQRLRGEERESIYRDFQDKKGQIISGTVFRNEPRQVVMSLDGAEAILPYEEQLRGESYISGDRLKVFILDVKRTNKGPKIVVSRSHPGLVKGLFQLEVPEVDDEVVLIKSIARAPGERTKIALQSMDESVDPVGACVGIRGSRVQAIVRELNNEKIDIVKWAEDTTDFINNAMNPAQLEQIILSDKARTAVVVVASDQLSLAIGKRGQNAKLAAKLTGWHIDIKNHDDYIQEQKAKVEKLLSAATESPLSELKGVGAAMLAKLADAGYKTMGDFKGVDADKLSEVPGLGAKTAVKLLEQAEALIGSLEVDEIEPAQAEEAASEEVASDEVTENKPAAEVAEEDNEPAQAEGVESGEAVEEKNSESSPAEATEDQPASEAVVDDEAVADDEATENEPAAEVAEEKDEPAQAEEEEK